MRPRSAVLAALHVLWERLTAGRDLHQCCDDDCTEAHP